MSTNRFVNRPDDGTPLHTSGYARVAHGLRMGASTPQSFRQRARIDANRRSVARYRDSLVANHHATYHRSQRTTTESIPPGRAATSAPPKPGTAAPPPRQTFQEPRSRGYNPYA